MWSVAWGGWCFVGRCERDNGQHLDGNRVFVRESDDAQSGSLYNMGRAASK